MTWAGGGAISRGGRGAVRLGQVVTSPVGETGVAHWTGVARWRGYYLPRLGCTTLLVSCANLPGWCNKPDYKMCPVRICIRGTISQVTRFEIFPRLPGYMAPVTAQVTNKWKKNGQTNLSKFVETMADLVSSRRFTRREPGKSAATKFSKLGGSGRGTNLRAR